VKLIKPLKAVSAAEISKKRNRMRSIYELVHLNPSRAAFLHLVLLGIPHRFGLLTTGWGNHYLPSELFPEPCSVFADGACNESELFTLRDSGVRFILYYELAWVVWFVMRKNTANIVAFHKILVGSSMASLLIMSWIQNYFHPSPNSPEFSPSFYTNLVFFHLLAISISLWTLAIHPKPSPGAMKWSIPANSIFCGAVVNFFAATAGCQMLLEEGGVENVYAMKRSATKTVKLCVFLAAFYTTLHGTLLLRMRVFLTMPQLRAVCLYKLVVNLVLPFLWLPEMSSVLSIDHRIPFAIRGVLTLSYLFGYLLAGQAEGVSRILTAEKDD
jgi:hypothetical protein